MPQSVSILPPTSKPAPRTSPTPPIENPPAFKFQDALRSAHQKGSASDAKKAAATADKSIKPGKSAKAKAAKPSRGKSSTRAARNDGGDDVDSAEESDAATIASKTTSATTATPEDENEKSKSTTSAVKSQTSEHSTDAEAQAQAAQPSNPEQAMQALPVKDGPAAPTAEKDPKVQDTPAQWAQANVSDPALCLNVQNSATAPAHSAPASNEAAPSKSPASQPRVQATALGGPLQTDAGADEPSKSPVPATVASTAPGAAEVDADDNLASTATATEDAKKSADSSPHAAVQNFAEALASATPKNTAPAAHAVTTGVAPVPPETQFAEVNHPRIVTSVHGQLLPNGGSMQLRLDPPDLGAMNVSVHMRDGVMTATFEASNDQAAQLLSHSLGDLKTALESQGVSVGQLHVQQAPRDSNGPSRDGGQGNDGRQFDQTAQQQEQQRREMLRRMWRRVSGSKDPLDLVA